MNGAPWLLGATLVTLGVRSLASGSRPEGVAAPALFALAVAPTAGTIAAEPGRLAESWRARGLLPTPQSDAGGVPTRSGLVVSTPRGAARAGTPRFRGALAPPGLRLRRAGTLSAGFRVDAPRPQDEPRGP